MSSHWFLYCALLRGVTVVAKQSGGVHDIGGIVCRPCWNTKRKSWLRDVPKMFTRRLTTVHVGNSVGRAQRASERSERSGQSDQDGLGELPSESCSKDAFRVREGRLRKAIQHVSPRAFILDALPVLLSTPGL